MNRIDRTEAEDLGKQVRKYRQKADMTQLQLADLVHMTRQNISHIENGEIYLSSDVIIRLLEVFQISPNEFFGYNGEKGIDQILGDCDLAEKRYLERVVNAADREYHWFLSEEKQRK